MLSHPTRHWIADGHSRSADTVICVGVFPLNRSGVSRIGIDIAAQFAGQICDGSEDATFDNFALDFRKPEFDLIQP
jgi:hypothetical protein